MLYFDSCVLISQVWNKNLMDESILVLHCHNVQLQTSTFQKVLFITLSVIMHYMYNCVYCTFCVILC